MIWHNQASLKVSVFAWRLLRDRLPTRFNLAHRGIILLEVSLCVSDCGSLETAQHLFLSCFAFSSLWPLVGVDSNVLSDHFFLFVYSTGGGKATRSFLQLIWLLCVWVLWNERNNMLFNNVVTPMSKLSDKVKYMSLAWMKAKNITFRFDTDTWCSSPFQCLGIT